MKINSLFNHRPMFKVQHCINRAALAVLLGLLGVAAAAAEPPSVQLEELTWPEVKERVEAGSTTILVPIGGTEQNGPYMVLGKHNVRAKYLADAIAHRLGNALVAPVVAYVPEGQIKPPASHMRFPGTISIPEAAFESLLESTARSFKQHGFRHIFFLGDHGGYQKNEEHVASRLNREWGNDSSCRAYALLDYYKTSEGAFVAYLKTKGLTDAEIGTHAGVADTSLAMAVDKKLVRTDALSRSKGSAPDLGVYGDPRKSSVELGQAGIELIVKNSVAAIQKATRSSR